jgi:trk system potassium uptake protein TrkA
MPTPSACKPCRIGSIIRTVCGHASYPAILEQAGTADADMLIALTDNDEVNMIACQIAYTLFNTPTKIARIRSGSYITLSGDSCSRTTRYR